jgi:hypothetical protein
MYFLCREAASTRLTIFSWLISAATLASGTGSSMASKIELSANDRYSIAGMTGTGKTAFATVLAHVLSTGFNPTQRVIWCQSKTDPLDLARLLAWGYKRVKITDLGRDKAPKQFVFLADDPKQMPVNWRIQRIARWSLKRQHVLLVLDEWAHGVISVQNAGEDLKNLHKTGRGAMSGVVGLTQELAFIPRQLFSQAHHKVLFRMDYGPDIKIARELFKGYDPEAMDRYGFWHRWSEGFGPAGKWHYYRDTNDWLERLGLERLIRSEPEPVTAESGT